jgi:glycosyltransferase involved in cell wall biosynthesis
VPSPFISFVVPAYNEEAVIGPTLDALRAAGGAVGEPFEIIVVDDGSTDSTAEIATAAGARVVPVHVRHIAAARNAGGRVATGDMLVFVDADTILPAEVLRKAVAEIRGGAIGGGAGVRQDTDEPRWGARSFRIVSWVLRIAGWAAGCFVYVRRDAFDRVGGFDERYFASEEIHFSRAVKKRGRFVILRDDVISSGRKARMFGKRKMVWQFVRAIWPGTLRERRHLDVWYGGAREKGGE